MVADSGGGGNVNGQRGRAGGVMMARGRANGDVDGMAASLSTACAWRRGWRAWHCHHGIVRATRG